MELQNYRGWEVYVDPDNGYAPYFQNMMRYRVNKKFGTNVVLTGEPGISKSYLGNDICRILDPRFCLDKLNWILDPEFGLGQLVFTYSEFLDLVANKKFAMGRPIVFDEPSYAMGKRDWYKELNKALVQTIESFRFKVHPLFIPIINKALLDKTIRSHLIQYQITVTKRGEADVYRIKPSQFIEEVYHSFFCHMKYGLFDNNLCDRESCLGCKKLSKCNIFRARYERKKASIQDKRYMQAAEDADRVETRQLSFEQIELKALQIRSAFTNEDDKIDINKMMIALVDNYGIRFGKNKAYRLKTALEVHYPDLFGQSM